MYGVKEAYGVEEGGAGAGVCVLRLCVRVQGGGGWRGGVAIHTPGNSCGNMLALHEGTDCMRT